MLWDRKDEPEEPKQEETVSQQDLVPAPDGVDVVGWREAEHAVRGRVGNYAGVSEERKYQLVWEAYDQLVENNRQAAKWEGRN